MKQFLVSVDVWSPSSKLADIERTLGHVGGAGSRTRGSGGPIARTAERTVWRLGSEATEDATLSEHIESVLELIALRLGKRWDALPTDAERSISVGVLHDTLTCSIALSADQLSRIASLDLSLEITTYPTAAEER